MDTFFNRMDAGEIFPVLIELLRLVNEHDGDVILDGVFELAGVADQLLILLVVFELALALGADQNL